MNKEYFHIFKIKLVRNFFFSLTCIFISLIDVTEANAQATTQSPPSAAAVGTWQVVRGCQKLQGTQYMKGNFSATPVVKWQANLSGTFGGGEGEPVVGDVNGDGLNEVVEVDANGGLLWVFNGTTGATIWSKAGVSNQVSVAIGDVNADGKMDILSTADKAYLLDGATGNIIWSWTPPPAPATGGTIPFTPAAFIGTSPNIGDLDKDGIPEAVIIVNDGVYILNGVTGTLKWQYATGNPNGIFGYNGSAPAIGDLNKDGFLEVVASLENGQPGGNFGGTGGVLVAINGNGGGLLWSVPGPSGFALGSACTPAIGDVDNDCNEDVVINKAAVRGLTGAKIWGDATQAGGATYNIIADLNDDCLVEVVTPCGVFRGKTGALIWQLSSCSSNGWFAPAPRVGDFNPGSAGKEILLCSAYQMSKGTQIANSIPLRLYAGFAGTLLWSYNLATLHNHTTEGVSVGDVDNDGCVEIVVSPDCCNGNRTLMILDDAGNTGACGILASISQVDFLPKDTTTCKSVNFRDFSTACVKSWDWSFPGGSPSSSTAKNPGIVNYNTPGTYTVKMKVNLNNCSTDSAIHTITVKTCGPTITAVGNSVCAGGCYTITSTASGGSAPYTYAWSPGGATTSTVNACPTSNITYTVTLTDNTGASNTNTVSVTINPSTTLTASKTDVKCVGTTDGTATASPAGGTGPYTYLWNSAPAQTGATASNLSPGTYTVTSTDSKGCTQTATATVGQPAALSIVPSSVPASCNVSNGSVSVAPTGGTGAYSYTWSSGSLAQTVTGLAATTYTVTVKDAYGCSASAVTTITNIPNGTVTTSVQANVSCNGGNNGSVTATIVGGAPAYTYSWSNSFVGQTANGLVKGTYTVTITDGNSCTSTGTISVTEPPVIVATTTSIPASCGTSSGSATLNPSGGTGAFGYTWSNGGTSQTIGNVLAGSYTVTVTDASNCTKTFVAPVSNNPAPTITNLTVNSSSCNGSNNGSASVVASGGTGNLTYSWSNGTSGATAVTGLSVNTYVITVTDASGCQVVSTVNITEPTALTANTTFTPATCGTANGSASVNANGGTGALVYIWSSSGGSASTATNLLAGPYTVTVTDTKGCTITASAIISNLGTGIATMAVQSDVSCAGGNNGSAFANITGGTPNYTYSWSSSAIGQTASNLIKGEYTVTITDANNCQVLSTVTITEPTTVVVSTTPVDATCGLPNGGASVNASGGKGSFVYSWSASGSTGQTATGLAPAIYTVTVTDANSCSKSATVTIVSNPPPTITNFTTVSLLCNGDKNGSATVVATGGTGILTYSWSTTASGVNAVSGLSAGAYEVSITDALGCTATQIVNITEPPLLNTPATTTTNASCGINDGSATASSSGGTGILTYTWSSGSNGAIAFNLFAGSYKVTVTDANGCSKTAVANVSNNGGPTITSLTPTNLLCKGASTGSAEVIISNGTTPYSYSWSTGATSLTNNTQSAISNLQAGIYTVTVKDANNCQLITTVELTEPSAITTTFATTDAACGQSNGSATATSVGGTGTFTYVWSNGTGGQTASNLLPATYDLTITDSNGCTKTASTIISNIGAPSALSSIVSPVACNAGTGSVDVTASGGTGPYTYSWSTGASSVTTNLQSLISNVPAATYTVTITDSKSCVAISTVTLTEPTVLSVTTSSFPSECGKNNGTATAVGLGGTSAYTYNWSNGNTGETIGGLAPVSYTVTLVDNNGCTISQAIIVSDTVFIITNSNPAQQIISEGNSVALIVSGGATYTWSPAAGLSCTSCPNPIAIPIISTTYTVIATDLYGCTAMAMIRITVRQPCTDVTDIFIANVFSPNNDGKNDLLYIEGNGLANIYWAIYDRWGNLLYEAFDQANGWDGSKKGNPMDAGTYVYYLKATCIKSNTGVRLKGNVSILK